MQLSRRVAAFLSVMVAIVCVATFGSNAVADDITTSTGKKFSGKLSAVDEQNVTLTAESAKVAVPCREIVVVSFGNEVLPPPKETFCEIELADGSVVRVPKFVLKEKKIEVEGFTPKAGQTAPTFELPFSSVFWVMTRADEQKQREKWKKMLGTRGKRDLYVVPGEEAMTFHQGTILDGFQSDKGPKVHFELADGGKDEFLQSRAAGFVFYQAPPSTVSPTLCRVSDIYGNSLNANAIAVSSEGNVVVTTVSGAKITYASTASLSKFDFGQGNVAYLSDLNPKVERPEVSADEAKLSPTVAYLKDRSLANETIKLENASYQKGLCVAPDTVLTYTLNGDYAQLRATVGIDANGSNATSAAKVTIEGDGQVLFSQAMTRKDKAKGLVLSVKGVKQLKIIVEADTPLNGNFVALAEASVAK